MKRRKILLLIPLLLCVLTLCAFTFDKTSTLKDLTHPYINTYECTSAKLGDENLLEKYEYFIITFKDDKNLEVSFKRYNGNPHSYVCEYSVNQDTNELTAEIGILGFKFRQTTIIENGKFTLSMPILGRPLIMVFEVK